MLEIIGIILEGIGMFAGLGIGIGTAFLAVGLGVAGLSWLCSKAIGD